MELPSMRLCQRLDERMASRPTGRPASHNPYFHLTPAPPPSVSPSGHVIPYGALCRARHHPGVVAACR